jgi:hypothetical protein
LCSRSIKDLKLSVQAKIISDYYYSLKEQGRRSDLIYRAAHGEERMMYELEEEYNRARGKKVNGFLRRFANKYERYDVKREVMERYGISGANIARMLRINKLIDPLKQYADEGKIGFIAAVQLSFLTDEAQESVAECIKEGAKINVKNAGKLKQTATSMRQRGEILSPEKLCAKVRRILLGAPPKPLFNKKSKAAPFSVAADASPQEENKPYKRIPDIEKYLKERFPAFFPENPEDMPAGDVFIRRTLYYFVRLNDACCSFFPDFFKPNDDYVAVLQKIFDATILYFEGLVLGTIQPPPEGI